MLLWFVSVKSEHIRATSQCVAYNGSINQSFKAFNNWFFSWIMSILKTFPACRAALSVCLWPHRCDQWSTVIGIHSIERSRGAREVEVLKGRGRGERRLSRWATSRGGNSFLSFHGTWQAVDEWNKRAEVLPCDRSSPGLWSVCRDEPSSLGSSITASCFA